MSREAQKIKKMLFGYVIKKKKKKRCAFHFFHIAMPACLFTQALGTTPKETITRVKRGNVLTLLHKQEMDFQDFSLSYA